MGRHVRAWAAALTLVAGLATTRAVLAQPVPATAPAAKEAKALLDAAVPEWEAIPAAGAARKVAAVDLGMALPLVGDDQRAIEIARNAKAYHGEDRALRAIAVTHARDGDAAGAMAAVGRMSAGWNWSNRAETLAAVARGLIQAGKVTEGGKVLADAYDASTIMSRRRQKDPNVWATTKELASALSAAGDAAGAAKLFARAEAEARATAPAGDAVQLGFRLTEIAAAALDGGAPDVADQFCTKAGDMAVVQRARLAGTRVRNGDVKTARLEAERVGPVWMRVETLRAIAKAQVRAGDKPGAADTAAALIAAAKGTPVSGQQRTWQAVAEAYGIAGKADAGTRAIETMLPPDRDAATASLAVGLGWRGDLAGARATAMRIGTAFDRGHACAAVARDAVKGGAARAEDVKDLVEAARSAFEALSPTTDTRPVATPLADAYVACGDVAAALRVVKASNPHAEDTIRALVLLARTRIDRTSIE